MDRWIMTEQAIVTPSDMKLATATFSFTGTTNASNPWAPTDVDKMDTLDIKEFRKVVEACRFFYRRDPLASTVLNKMVEIGITKIEFSKNGISKTEAAVYEGIKDKLAEFAEAMAMEFLISGLVVPEMKFAPVVKDDLLDLSIKRYDHLQLPVSMWIRDPNTIVVNQTILSDQPSYYVEIPAEFITFIQARGQYPDGTWDKVLYENIVAYYPQLIMAIEAGEKTILLDNKNVIRRKMMSDTAYPIPYLYPAIEPLKHKRNMRRMDYSIAARVISAIQLVQLGSDLFPITEQDQDQFEDIKTQMLWRNGTGRDVERIFQLFANHTLKITWVTPPVDALLNESKYKDINEDIISALGFPRILITGETLRSSSSDAQFSSISAVKTMENFRSKIRVVLQDIINKVAKLNSFKNTPRVFFAPLQIVDFTTFVTAIQALYDSGNLSRTSFAEIFGFSWEDEMEEKMDEQKVLEASKLPEFAPAPFSPAPNTGGGAPTGPQKPAAPAKMPMKNMPPASK
jgi:hypothetical protein